MAQRGRKPKAQTVITEIDYAKLLKDTEVKYHGRMEELYKKISAVRFEVSRALNLIGIIDESSTLAEAAYKAGKSYVSLDEAYDKLEEILEEMYSVEDFDHWEDVLDQY